MSDVSFAGSEFEVPIRTFISNITSLDSVLSPLESVFSQQDADARPSIAVSSFAALLNRLQVQGPCMIASDEPTLIGSGAQFLVYKDRMYVPDDPGYSHLAALKFPRFLLDAKTKLDLSNPIVERHIKDLIIEVAALRHPTLRHHRNIVDLLGWGLDNINWHKAPFLMLELADMDLSQLLKSEQNLPVQQQVCLLEDVACGLDAIHRVGLIHGDIKPENVLVFKNVHKWVAKLSDFGGGAGLEDMTTLQGRGTVGWRAPELRRYHDTGDALDQDIIYAIDAYSYGLLTWCVLCMLHEACPGSEGDIASELAQTHLSRCVQVSSLGLLDAIKKAVARCLDTDPKRRPTVLTGLLHDPTLEHDPEAEEYTGDAPNDAWDSEWPYKWEIPETNAGSIELTVQAFLTDPTSVTADMAFQTFLRRTSSPTLYNHAHLDTTLRLLRASAAEGLHAARALCFQTHDFFGIELEVDFEAQRKEWPIESISSGALFLVPGTTEIGDKYEHALEKFRSSGGFNTHYGTIPSWFFTNALNTSMREDFIAEHSASSPEEPIDSDGDCALHLLSSFNDPRLSRRLEQVVIPDNINTLNARGETPLYQACRAGAADTVELLLSQGADASIRPFGEGPTCLHWLFVFETSRVKAIAQKLVRNGAMLDSQSTSIIQMKNYPFILPLGDPLHWAVEFSSRAAVAALLSLGADTSLRTTAVWRSYWDIGGEDMGYDVPHCCDLQYSSIELAVAGWNHEILDMLLRHSRGAGQKPPTDSVDDRIVHPAHSLHMKRWLHVLSSSAWFLPRLVQGTHEQQLEKVQRTIDVLIRYGHPINTMMASPPSTEKRPPLQAAAENGDLVVVEALLRAGADINAKSSSGATALISTHNLDSPETNRMLNLLLAWNPDINAQDDAGHTALTAATGKRDVEAVSTLLEAGANILSRFPDFRGKELGMSVFSALTQCMPAQRISRDKQLASLMRRHLLPLLIRPDGRRMRITEHPLNDGDVRGSTLLHYTASECHNESCAVLLAAGADVNRLTLRVHRKTVYEHNSEEKQHQTPLDEALSFRSSLEKSVWWRYNLSKSRTSNHGSKQVEMLRDVERTITLLQSWGGVTSEEMEDSTFSSSQSRIPSSETTLSHTLSNMAIK